MGLGWGDRYWLKYTIVIASQLTAAALLVTFWLDAQRVNSGIWIAAFLVIVAAANYCFASSLAAWEAILTFLKVLVVIGLIVLAIVLMFAPRYQPEFLFWGGQLESHGYGEVLGRLSAICETLPSATFAYLGCEMIGMASLRTRDPCRTTARAIKLTSYRLVGFNVVSMILVVMLVPNGMIHVQSYDDTSSTTAMSAFVVAIQMARIPVLPHLLNACILLFALSSAAFSLYLTTGALYRMSLANMAPACLSTTDTRGVPVFALALCSCLASLAYLNITHDSKIVFSYLVNLVTMLSILTWVSILITHLSFKRAQKAQGIPDSALAFRAPLGQVGSWIALFGCLVVSLTRIVVFIDHIGTGTGYHASIMSYLGIPLYLALLLGYKLVTRGKSVNPTTSDLFNHHRPVESAVSGAVSGPEPISLCADVRKALGRQKQRAKRFAQRWVS